MYRGVERLSTYSDRDNLFAFEIEPGEDGEMHYTKVYMRQSRLAVFTDFVSFKIHFISQCCLARLQMLYY